MAHDDAVTKPSIDRAWELMERASNDRGSIKVLGWADDMAMLSFPNALTFTVTQAIEPLDQEDHVLIIAVRIPHPDEMTLDEVIGRSDGLHEE